MLNNNNYNYRIATVQNSVKKYRNMLTIYVTDTGIRLVIVFFFELLEKLAVLALAHLVGHERVPSGL